MRSFRFSPALPQTPAFTLGDGLIVLGLGVLIYAGARLAVRTPAVIAGPDISLSFRALPWYAFLSTGRMTVAYFLSLLFTLTYGYAAARNRTAEKVLLPLLKGRILFFEPGCGFVDRAGEGGVDLGRYSLVVRLFHPQLLAGFKRRTITYIMRRFF